MKAPKIRPYPAWQRPANDKAGIPILPPPKWRHWFEYFRTVIYVLGQWRIQGVSTPHENCQIITTFSLINNFPIKCIKNLFYSPPTTMKTNSGYATESLNITDAQICIVHKLYYYLKYCSLHRYLNTFEMRFEY